MSLLAEKKSMKMKIRDIENAFRYRRIPYPKRSVELIALIAISCTFFLFMHTKNLNTRLREMEVKLQPSEFSALGLTGEHHLSGGDSGHSNDINTLHGTYQYLKSTGQINSLIADKLNNTRHAQVDILFFNRVPKVGSQSLMELMKRLAEVNGFTANRDKPKELETILVVGNKEFEVADEIMELKEPATYSKHIAYLNFTHLDYPKPIYINLIRDPIERLVSWFYYIRAPWYIADRKKHFPEYNLPSIQWLKKDFASCLRANDPECIYEQNTRKFLGDHRRQMLFFCGQEGSVCLYYLDEDEVLQQKVRAILCYVDGRTLRWSLRRRFCTYLWCRINDNQIRHTQIKTYFIRKFLLLLTLLCKIIIVKLDGLDAFKLNNTRKAERDLLFFNRVPKVGSEQLIELLRRLSIANNFSASRASFATPIYSRLTGPQQLNMAMAIDGLPQASAYSRHENYINFTKYDFPKPIYINLVRDPVERVISWFYYRRAPWTAVLMYKANNGFRKPSWYKKNYAQCVISGEVECLYTQGAGFKNEIVDHRRQSLFFCGHDPVCEPFNGEGALQLAKRNVESEYAVVGSWEDVNITLTVLEKYVPRFFNGALSVYYDGLEQNIHNKNPWKAHIGDDIKEMVRKNFTNEIEFYNFCKQRLYKQYYALRND